MPSSSIGTWLISRHIKNPMLVTDINLGRRHLDFSSSGQGRFNATEVCSGDTKLVNAVELLDFSDGLVQVLGALQLTAPGRVLGPLGILAELNSENIVAVTEGDLNDEVAEFRKLISTIDDDADGLHAEAPQRVIEFHLDIPTFPAWRPFGYD